MIDMLAKVKAVVKLIRAGRASQTQAVPINGQSRMSLRPVHELNTRNQKRTEKNEEDVTIVWLSKTTKNQEFIASLRSIIDCIQVFDNEEYALAYIESIFQEKIILIVDYLSDHLLTVLEAFKQVDAVFLYTSVSPDTLRSGITAFCSTEQKLINEIEYTCQRLSQQMVVFSIYNQKNKEKRDLTREAGSFLFFQLFKAAFKQLPKNSESKKIMISKCRDYYAGNAKVLEQITDFELNYKSTEALQWYTNNSFIYRLINKALRTENIHSLCYFHFYIGDLSKQLEKEFLKLKKQNPKSIMKFYRSFKITRDEINNFERNVNSLILTNGYLSTTRERQIACDFAMKLNTQFDEEKVLFEYTVDLTLVKSIIFADISQYNKFPEGNEILFDLGTAFKMNSCTYNDKETLWIVNVSATDEGVDIATEYIEYQKAKMTESNIMLMLGHLIVEAGDYNKAEKYFDAILHSSIPNDEEIACIYYNIGRVYRLKGQYDHALEYLNRAYVEHSKARPPRLVSAAKALNAMGIVHTEQKNVQQAIDSFESALKLYTKTIQGYHPDVAGTLVNLGNIYCEQENFANALSCFNRARKIYQCNLPPNHPNIATLLNNIGNLYYQQLKLDLALDAYQRALEINEKILPPNHPDIARTRHNLSKVYTTLGDQQKAAFELERAPEYDLVAGYQFIDSTPTNSVPWDAMDIDNASKSKMDLIEINNY